MNKDSSHEELVPYSNSWPQKYSEEADKIKKALGDRLLAIEHIGSTSIPGLVSKPIIDIAVMVEDAKTADTLVSELENIGYSFDKKVHEGNPNPERHLFRKYKGEENFHLSLAYKERGEFWKRQILFRDYLRNHDDYRDKYAELKKELLEKDKTGQGSYIGGKTEFVTEVLKKAGFDSNYIN